MAAETASPAEIELRERLMQTMIEYAKDGRVLAPGLLGAVATTLAGTMAMIHCSQEQAATISREVADYAVQQMATFQKSDQAKAGRN
jgi:hypothetical protein